MKTVGKVQRGAYAGQDYYIIRRWFWPGWCVVRLTDATWPAEESYVLREVREECLEYD